MATLNPWLHICHLTAGVLRSCVSVLQPRSLGQHRLREHKPHLLGSSSDSTFQPPLPLKAEQRDYTPGVPKIAGKVTSSAAQP